MAKRSVGPVTVSAAGGTGAAGALAFLIVWVLTANGVDVPPEGGAVITVLLGAVGSVVGGWLVKPKEDAGE